jgi:hypothetical protein
MLGQHDDVQFVTARECDSRFDGLKEKMSGFEKWLTRIDQRIWSLVVGILLNVLATLGSALIILSRIPE